MPLLNNTNTNLTRSQKFPDDYVQNVFTVWYSSNKPALSDLRNLIPEYKGKKPTLSVLDGWIKERFVPKAFMLDEEAAERLDRDLVAVKVEMMQRHVQLSQEMQDLGIGYLRNEGVDDAKTAVRLLVEGINIENKNAGIAEIVRRMQDWSDEKVLDELRKAIEDSPITAILPMEED